MSVQPTLELLLLGTPQVIYAGQDVTDKLPAKAQAMLYYLAVTGETFSRQALAGLLWGGVAERKALTSLRVALNRMRKVLPEHWEATQQTLAFLPGDTSVIDVQVLSERAAPDARASRPELRQALALYRDDFLAGFLIDDAPQFDEWLDAQRTHYRQLTLDGLARLSEHLLADHAYADAVDVLQRTLEIQPWDEATHRRLMLAHCRLNNLDAALAQFEHCHQALRDALQVDPMPETLALHERIETARHGIAHNIPADSTPFIGRTAEVAQVRRQLMDSRCRLLTLLGPGGIGKTRLARHVARSLVDESAGVRAFINGAFWVPLESVSSPSGIIAAIAHGVGFSFYGGVPPLQQLADFFRTKEMLLVVDNLEHLLDDGVDVFGELLAEAPDLTILATSREILNLYAEWTIEIDGLTVPDGGHAGRAEQPDPAAAAAPPTQEAIAGSEAVQLFVERAQRVDPGFPLYMADGALRVKETGGATEAAPAQLMQQVAQICQLVGGIPLAIELAAAWLGTRSLAEISGELTRSLDILTTQESAQIDRHASMRTVFNHSWEMLEPREQQVLRRLSVFRGGFDWDAATVVAGASIMDLALFSEKSLLRHEPVHGPEGEVDRYYIHELLRQYIAEKLAEAPPEQAETRTSHSTYYLELLSECQEPLQGDAQQRALMAIGWDVENVRAGWFWAIETENWPLLERALESLYHFHQIRSFYAAGEECVGALLRRLRQPDLAGQAALRPLLTKALSRRGAFLQFLCNYEVASVDLVEARRLAQALEMPAEEAFALNMLGQIATWQGDRNSAQNLLRNSLTISRGIGDRSGIAHTLEKLANTLYGTFGEYDQDKALALEALEICRAMGRPDWTAHTLDTLGFVTFCLGEYESSLAYYRESEALFSEIRDSYGLALALGGLGLIYWALGQEHADESIRYFERSLALTREIGNRGQDAGRLVGLARLYNERGDVEAARRSGREALKIGQVLESPIYLAHAFTSLGDTARLTGDYGTGRDYLRQSIDIAHESQVLPLLAMALFYYAELLVTESEQEALPPAEAEALRRQAWQILGHLKTYEPLWHVFQARAAERHAQLDARLSPAPDPNAPDAPPLDELVRTILRRG